MLNNVCTADYHATRHDATHGAARPFSSCCDSTCVSRVSGFPADTTTDDDVDFDGDNHD